MAHHAHTSTINPEPESFSYPSDLLADVPCTLSPTKSRRTVNYKPTGRGCKRPTDTVLQPPPSKLLKDDHGPSRTDLTPPPPPPPQDAFDAQFDPPSSYSLYKEAVTANCAGFYRVSQEFFVVQGWEVRRDRASVSCLCTNSFVMLSIP